jgi:cytochrome P450
MKSTHILTALIESLRPSPLPSEPPYSELLCAKHSPSYWRWQRREKADILCAGRHYLLQSIFDASKSRVWGRMRKSVNQSDGRQLVLCGIFVPFVGGSRICPAHVMVDTECSLVIFRLFQTFSAFEATACEPYTAVMRVGPSNRNGCKVAFTVA